MIVDVRNLRVAVVLIRDAVTVIILVRDIRLAVTIGIQLELRLSVVGGTIRVGHNNRNVEFLLGVLVQLGLIRVGNGDLTGVLVDLDFVTLRSLEVLRNSELGALRSLDLLLGRVALFIHLGEGRRRLGLLARNNQLLLVCRSELVCILGHQDGPCGHVVATGDQDDVEVVALLGIVRDVEGAGCDLSLDALGLVELASLKNLALLVTPLNLRRQGRQVAAELRGHRGARSSRLIRRVVVSRDRYRSVRHDAVVHVVQRVQVLERSAVEVDWQLVLTRNR